MKILYITFENLSLHKGSVVHVRETVDGLQKLGHHIGLIARSENKFEGCDHFYNLHRGARLKGPHYLISSVSLFFYLLRLLPSYHIIYVRDFYAVIIAMLPRFIFRRKLVFEVNGIANEEQRLKGNSLFNRIFALAIRNAERMAVLHADRVVSVTSQIASYLTQDFKCQPDKIEIVSNGVNTELFYDIQDRTFLSEWRRRWGIDPEDTVIGFVGNLAPWQGVEYLVQAAPVLVTRFTHIRFLIVGSGPLKESLEVETVRLALSDHFVFTGMADYQEIPYYINMADVCLVLKRPLKSGYSPIKLYEYMACGKPVVASRVEGLEFIETERVGRLVAPEDPIMLGEALVDLLEHPGERIEMGERGRQLVLKQFTWDSKVMEIETVLRELA
jgi:glycosyltransferase involved in cell wall biosynthesis